MATEAELTNRLREILPTTITSVRQKLEEEFGVDLSDKKAFIREQIYLYLQSQAGEEEADEVEKAEGGVEEAEEEVVVSKAQELEVAAEKKRSQKEDNVVKKGGGGRFTGFTMPFGLSPQLQKITGVPELSRNEVVKKLWSYIREHDLQDPRNRQRIVCDDALRELFNVDTIDMNQMNKSLSKHIWPLNSTCVASSSAAKEKKRKQDTEEDSEESNRKEKRQKSANSDSMKKEDNVVKMRFSGGFLRAYQDHLLMLASSSAAKEKQRKQDTEEDSDESNRKEKQQKSANSDSKESNIKEKKQELANSASQAPIALSEHLIKFFGTGETAMTRSDVYKKIWGYIKQNNLQDPSNKQKILCDEKLQKLFSVDQFTGFSMSRLLRVHLTKKKQ